jgi:hypothetical protein
LILSVLALLPATVVAQQPEPQLQSQRPILKITGDYGLSAEDKATYCFWSGQLYSIGSSFCTRQQTVSTCTATSGGRPIWVTKDNDKFCDRNPSLTPQ